MSPHGVVYVLRIWHEGPEADARGWRASLADPQGSERLYFASLSRLLGFLAERHPQGAEATPAAPAADSAPDAP